MSENNDMVKKTCGIAKNLLKKTQEVLEMSHINLKILKLKNRIERKYVKIGYFVYNKQKNFGFEKMKYELETDDLKNICGEIERLYKNIEKLKKELSEIKKCNYCGDCSKRDTEEKSDSINLNVLS